MDAGVLLGKGIYSVPEAARIVHTDARSIRRWTMGYTLPASQRFSAPILSTTLAPVEEEEVLTFHQLIEVLFINLFRKHRVSMPVIRAAAAYAATLFHTNHPFAVEGFKTDGKSIFHQSHFSSEEIEGITQAQLVQDILRGQFVFGEFVEPYFLKIDYERFEAARYWPLGKDKRIVIDPARSFGQPIDSATGVPTKAIYSMYLGGDAPEHISRWFGVERQAIINAIAFEQTLQ